jgi:hypothetical protein
MAVAVSDATNTSYDGYLATANGFYRAEASNLATMGAGLSLSSDRTLAVTFANSGNLQGIALAIYPSTTLTRSVTVKLQVYTTSWGDVAGCTKTLTVAEMHNSVLSNTQGGLIPFIFGTPAAVDTTASKWRFYISDSAGTGNNVLRTSDGTNLSFVAWCDNKISYTTNQDQLIVYAPVQIDGSYTFKGALGTGLSTHSICGWVLRSTTPTPDNVALLTWKNPPTAPWTLTLDGLLVLGSHSGVRLGTSTNPISVANKATVITKRTPTLGSAGNAGFSTLTGANDGSARASYFFYGDKPAYPSATLEYEACFGGTATMTIADPCVVTKSGHLFRAGVPCPLTFSTTVALPTGITAGTVYWGLYVTTSTLWLYDTYANALAGGTTGRVVTSGTQSGVHTLNSVLYTVETTDWTVGQVISVGGQNVNGPGDSSSALQTYTISAISGKEIKVTGNLLVSHRRVGGKILLDGENYGIVVKIDTGTTPNTNYIGTCSNLIISGAYIYYWCVTSSSSGYGTGDNSANRSQMLVQDVTFRGGTVFFNNYAANENGLLINRCYGLWSQIMGNFHAGSPSRNGASGIITESNCISINGTSRQAAVNSSVSGFVSSGNINQNINGYALRIIGPTVTLTNNTHWGCSGSTGPYYVDVSIGGRASGNVFNLCTAAYSFYTTVDFISTGDTFGNITANTTDIVPQAGYYVDATFKSPIGTATVSSNYSSMVTGSAIKVENYNNTTSDDRVWKATGKTQRTISGLTDTTVRTAGGSAMRYLPESSTTNHDWTFSVATGNILGQATDMGIWVYINNAAYWAGTNQMPRITVNYDNGTTTYGEAAQTAGSWQYIHAVFTPTTSYGSITVTLSAMTDATLTNAYVYWDDFSGGFLVNTTMDSWSSALPVPPAYSFNVNAADFWDASTAGRTAAGSMGSEVNGINDYLEMKL